MIQLRLRNKISFKGTDSNKNYSILLTERCETMKIARTARLFGCRESPIAQIIATILFCIRETPVMFDHDSVRITPPAEVHKSFEARQGNGERR